MAILLVSMNTLEDEKVLSISIALNVREMDEKCTSFNLVSF